MSGGYYRSTSSFRSFSHDEEDEQSSHPSFRLFSSPNKLNSLHSSPTSSKNLSLSVSPKISPNEREKFSIYEDYYSKMSSSGGDSSSSSFSTFSHSQNSYSFRKYKKNKQEGNITRGELIGIVLSALLSLFFGFLIIVGLYFLMPVIFGSFGRTLGSFSNVLHMVKNNGARPERDNKVTYIYHSDTNTFSRVRKRLSLASFLEDQTQQDLDYLISVSSNKTFQLLKPKSLLTSAFSSNQPDIFYQILNPSIALETLYEVLNDQELPTLSVSSSQYTSLENLYIKEEENEVALSDLFHIYRSCTSEFSSCQEDEVIKLSNSIREKKTYSLHSASLFQRWINYTKDIDDVSLSTFFSKEALERGKISVSLSSSKFHFSLRSHQSLLLNGNRLWVGFPSDTLPYKGFSLDKPVSTWLKNHKEFYFESEEADFEDYDRINNGSNSNLHLNFECYDKKYYDFLKEYSQLIMESISSSSISTNLIFIVQRVGQVVNFPSGWFFGFVDYEEGKLESNFLSESFPSVETKPQFSLELEGEIADSTQSLYYLTKSFENLKDKNLEESMKMFKILNFISAYENSGSKAESKTKLTSNVVTLELLYNILSEIIANKITEKEECKQQNENKILIKLLYIILKKNPQNYSIITKALKLLLESSLEELANKEELYIEIYEYCLDLINQFDIQREVFNSPV